MCHFLAQNGPLVPINFSWYKPLLLLSSTYWLFHCAKFLKKSYSRSSVIRMCHFWAQNGPFTPNKIFFGKLLISFSSTYSPILLSKILKKLFQRIQSYEDVQFLGPKWPIFTNENFFRKPANEPCFFHSCLSTCQKSKSDIDILVKY